MTWGLRQTVELFGLLGFGLLVHAVVILGRRAYVAGLTELAGPRMRSMVAVYDVVIVVLVMAYAAVAVSFEGTGAWDPIIYDPSARERMGQALAAEHTDQFLNELGLLALLLAALEIWALRLLHLVAHNLVWPRRWFVPRFAPDYTPPAQSPPEGQEA